MQVQINGEARELNHNEMVLAELVRELDLAPQRIAVEVNKRIIRRSEWDQTTINDGDRIEIVHFVGGGSDYAGRAISLQKSLRDLFERVLARRTREIKHPDHIESILGPVGRYCFLCTQNLFSNLGNILPLPADEHHARTAKYFH